MARIEVGVGPAGVPFVERRDHARQFLDFAQRVEQLGFRSLCVGDHLDGRGAPLTSLAVAAGETNRLVLATHVICAELRQPAVLAQEVRTLHVLSGARLELGLGVGWLERDFEAAGMPMAPFRTRLERLRTCVATVRGSLEAAGIEPPRIVIGGGGTHMLAMAAEVADIVTINIPLRAVSGIAENILRAGTRPFVAARIEHVRAVAAKTGRAVDLHLYVHEAHVGAEWRDVAVRRAASLGLSFEDYVASPHVLVGDTARVAATLEERQQELGLDYVSIPGSALDSFAPVLERLGAR